MKISIIGMGRVGSSLAFTLMQRGLGTELVLMDEHRQRAEGDALDLAHAQAFTQHPMTIRAGGIADTAASDVLVLTCSTPWHPHYTSRFDIGYENTRMFRELVPALAAASPQACVLVVSNPVDVMTYHAVQLSGFGPHRVFGTGTLIDSARFRMSLSQRMGIHPDDLRAYILGEHGDTQFPVFSLAMAGGTRIVSNEITRDTFRQTMRAGFDVVHKKGHTNYAISLAAALVVEALVWDTRRTMPLSVLVDGFLGISEVCLSLPVVVGRGGITRVLQPEFSAEEAAAFRACAEVVRAGIARSLQAPAAAEP